MIKQFIKRIKMIRKINKIEKHTLSSIFPINNIDENTIFEGRNLISGRVTLKNCRIGVIGLQV